MIITLKVAMKLYNIMFSACLNTMSLSSMQMWVWLKVADHPIHNNNIIMELYLIATLEGISLWCVYLYCTNLALASYSVHGWCIVLSLMLCDHLLCCALIVSVSCLLTLLYTASLSISMKKSHCLNTSTSYTFLIVNNLINILWRSWILATHS